MSPQKNKIVFLQMKVKFYTKSFLTHNNLSEKDLIFHTSMICLSSMSELMNYILLYGAQNWYAVSTGLTQPFLTDIFYLQILKDQLFSYLKQMQSWLMPYIYLISQLHLAKHCSHFQRRLKKRSRPTPWPSPIKVSRRFSRKVKCCTNLSGYMMGNKGLWL